jgi:hypothetical protein
MTASRRVAAATALAGVSLYGGVLMAQHEHGAHASPAAEPPNYLTVNVSLSNAGIEPSAVFVPAGQPVQLMLRNRTTGEHHYRVVGLTPDDIAWVERGGSAAVDATLAEPGHDHHNRQLVRTRTVSPAGIAPTGREVHGYVSAATSIDVVLFTATDTGTFVVQCDLSDLRRER